MMAWDIAYAKLKERMDSELGLVAELDERVQELSDRVEKLESVLDDVRDFLAQGDADDFETWKTELSEKLSIS